VPQKGDVLAVARVAAIQAAKRTWELIPSVIPIALTGWRCPHRAQWPMAANAAGGHARNQRATGVRDGGPHRRSGGLLTSTHGQIPADSAHDDRPGGACLEKAGGRPWPLAPSATPWCSVPESAVGDWTWLA